jgi:hypothetical protein
MNISAQRFATKTRTWLFIADILALGPTRSPSASPITGTLESLGEFDLVAWFAAAGRNAATAECT